MPGPMLVHLARVARDAREQAGVRQIDIAITAAVSHTVISKFERAQAWPLDPERILDAYAAETGVPTWRLWRAATDLLHD